jgi:hypothetical protein
MDIVPPSMPIAASTQGAVFGGGALSVSSFLEGVKSKAPRGGGARMRTKLTDLEVAVKNAKHRAATGEWCDASSPTIVGLYAYQHEIVYKEMPLELEQKMEFKRAAGMAKTTIQAFDGDVDAVVEFMKWAWKREQGRIKWSKDNGRERNRFSYRFLFSASQITDYRVERKQHPRGQ